MEAPLISTWSFPKMGGYHQIMHFNMMFMDFPYLWDERCHWNGVIFVMTSSVIIRDTFSSGNFINMTGKRKHMCHAPSIELLLGTYTPSGLSDSFFLWDRSFDL